MRSNRFSFLSLLSPPLALRFRRKTKIRLTLRCRSPERSRFHVSTFHTPDGLNRSLLSEPAPTEDSSESKHSKKSPYFRRASESRRTELHHHHRDRVRVLQQVRAVVGADGLQLLRSRGPIADQLRVLAGDSWVS